QDLLADEAEKRRAIRLSRAPREPVEARVDRGQLLQAREMCELRCQLVRLERRQRVLMLELRDEEMEELRLRDRGTRRDRAGGRLGRGSGDGIDRHARTLSPRIARGS